MQYKDKYEQKKSGTTPALCKLLYYGTDHQISINNDNIQACKDLQP